MHLQSIIAAAGGLVVATSALLLPPDLPVPAADNNDVVSALPIPSDVEIDVDMILADIPGFQTVMLECPGCLSHHGKHHKGWKHKNKGGKHSNPMIPAGKKGEHEHKKDQKHHKGHKGAHRQKEIPSHLKLDFGIEQGEDGDRLTMNGYQLYPIADSQRGSPIAAVLPDMPPPGMPPPPEMAHHMPGHIKGFPIPKQAFQTLGFITHSSVRATGEEDGSDLSVIDVELQIMQVGDKFTKDIDMVVVSLVKSASGKLAISRILEIEKPDKHSPTDDMKECSTVLCKWRAMILEKLSSFQIFKPCSGRKGQGMLPPPHGDKMSEGPHHPHMHHHGSRHPWARFIVRIVTHILLPVLIGILAGVSAGLIGMMVGTIIVFVWRLLFRREGVRHSHRCRYARRAARREAALAADEKAGLMEQQEEEAADLPPKYDEAEN
ncbi:hypothetical protein F5Y16DRAFT_380969 [Xylariaceae sp. FL0255]|nr:hypothetical protein F5Y16DRAFT_380969 [Xylariaceae sp. FL0255]